MFPSIENFFPPEQIMTQFTIALAVAAAALPLIKAVETGVTIMIKAILKKDDCTEDY